MFNLNFLFENSKYLIEQGCHVNDGQQTVYEKLPYQTINRCERRNMKWNIIKSTASLWNASFLKLSDSDVLVKFSDWK